METGGLSDDFGKFNGLCLANFFGSLIYGIFMIGEV